MNREELKDLLAQDRCRWEDKSELKLRILRPEYKLIRRKRYCDYYHEKKAFVFLYLLFRFLYHRSCIQCGCDIPSHTVIGGGFKLIHGRGVVINSKSTIGKNVTVLSCALIGANRSGIPTIGDYVEIGAHSIILGGVKIGDHAEIGAGAIITHDVPDNGVAYCEAGRVHRIKVQI